MGIEIHAPSTLVLVVALALAALALISYLVAGNVVTAFWCAIMAYVVSALGTTVKT